MYDGADEGHGDVFVSAVVEAELGQHQAERRRGQAGADRAGAGQGNTALPGRDANGPMRGVLTVRRDDGHRNG